MTDKAGRDNSEVCGFCAATPTRLGVANTTGPARLFISEFSLIIWLLVFGVNNDRWHDQARAAWIFDRGVEAGH